MRKLIEIEHDAREYGFDWPNHEMIIDQAISESEEVRQALRDGEPPIRVQEEIGDLIHTAISLCIFSGFDVDQTIQLVTVKFARRMKLLKQVAAQRGLQNLRGQSIDFMLELWAEVKKLEHTASV